MWNNLSAAEQHRSLYQVVLGLVRLCHTGWVNYDCRLANYVIDKDGNLTAIDMDWIESVNDFRPPSTKNSSLWYPTCLNPMLYLAWQANVSAKLLLRCDSLQRLQKCLDRLDIGDPDLVEETFKEFEQRMNESGWTGEDPPELVLDLVLGK